MDSDDGSNDGYGLTPRTEERYQKINQEFDLMMQRNQVVNRVSEQIFFQVRNI